MDVIAETNCSGVVSSETADSRLSEESLNQFTHGIGFGLSVLGAIHLLATSETTGLLTLGCWLYALSLVALYAASTLSHSFLDGARRTRYRTIDQVCIFAMMAATFTPVSLRACNDGLWNAPLVIMWCMAVLGIYLKLRVTKHEMVPVWFYVTLGLMPIFTLPRLVSVLDPGGVLWFVAGGGCYLVGVLFLTNDHRSRFFHPIWHVLVILGSTCHYIVVCDYSI